MPGSPARGRLAPSGPGPLHGASRPTRGLVGILVALALLAAGCGREDRLWRTSPFEEQEDSGERVNLWPLAYHDGDATSILWPLFDYERDADRSRSSFLYCGYRSETRAERSSRDIFPLITWDTGSVRLGLSVCFSPPSSCSPARRPARP